MSSNATKRSLPLVHEEDDGESSSDDDGPKPMPAASFSSSFSSSADPGAKRKKRKLAHERAFLAKLPSAEMYEKSYMHRDVVTHVAITPQTDFVVTASCDGHVKFWKKMMEGIEFVKHFHAHVGAIHALEASEDGLRIATVGADKAVKLCPRDSGERVRRLRAVLSFIKSSQTVNQGVLSQLDGQSSEVLFSLSLLLSQTPGVGNFGFTDSPIHCDLFIHSFIHSFIHAFICRPIDQLLASSRHAAGSCRG